MDQNNHFQYFYNHAADMFTFYRIPKLLFKDVRFSFISTEAKLLYGIMLDRMSLSVKNQWIDPEGRVYIYFSIEDVMEHLNCKKNKAVDTMKELDSATGIGLIEKRRQGQGKPARIYVKNFMANMSYDFDYSGNGQNIEFSEVGKTNLLKLEKQTSRSLKNKPLEVGKTNPNNTDINNTDINENESNPIISAGGEVLGYGELEAYRDIIKENIELDALIRDNPYDTELLRGMYELIVETVLDRREACVIASSTYPGELVRSKFMKLNSSHIRYVLECFKGNTTKVRNIKKYLLAALFNAPSTMDGYYQAEVNHDMPQFTRRKIVKDKFS